MEVGRDIKNATADNPSALLRAGRVADADRESPAAARVLGASPSARSTRHPGNVRGTIRALGPRCEPIMPETLREGPVLAVAESGRGPASGHASDRGKSSKSGTRAASQAERQRARGSLPVSARCEGSRRLLAHVDRPGADDLRRLCGPRPLILRALAEPRRDQ